MIVKHVTKTFIQIVACVSLFSCQGNSQLDLRTATAEGILEIVAQSKGEQAVLVNFWATWCGPCRETMPEVQRLHQKYGNQLQVVGINIEGKSQDVLSYLDEGGYTFPVLFDSGNWDSIVATNYGVSSIPRTFLIDRNGRVLYEGHPQGLTEEQIQAAIASR